MKKLNFLLLIALLSFFSCSEEEILPTVEDVIGDWSVTALDYTGVSYVEVLTQSYSTNFTGVGKNMEDMRVVFTGDPQEFITSGSYDIELNYEYGGQKFTQLTEDLPFLIPSGEWELEGKNLSLIAPGIVDPSTAKIISFTDDTLVFTVSEVTETASSGYKVVYEINLQFTMTRQ